jgi:CRISPR-associated protein Csc1
MTGPDGSSQSSSSDGAEDLVGRSLGDFGVVLWRGEAQNHDFLWFASTDVNARSDTAPILHNYALTFALCDCTHAASVGFQPDYDRDFDVTSWYDGLPGMPGYALPARYSQLTRRLFTHNALDDRGVTPATKVSFNTPKLGQRIVFAPVVELERDTLTLWFFARRGYRPPSVFRLGKKGCQFRARWSPVEQDRFRRATPEGAWAHPLNPRDLLNRDAVRSFWPVALPPHLLFWTASTADELGIFQPSDGWVHVPRRVLGWCRERRAGS